MALPEHKKEDKRMVSKSNAMTLEQKKIELIKMRIRNKYYEKEDVLEKVVHEILHKNIHPTN